MVKPFFGRVPTAILEGSKTFLGTIFDRVKTWIQGLSRTLIAIHKMSKTCYFLRAQSVMVFVVGSPPSLPRT